jgi:hypothetical protein
MQRENDTLVRVHREWDGWRSAEVRIGDLEDVHWFQPSGAPHTLVHAFVPCRAATNGDIPHECDRSSAPHRLLVCVLKRHTVPTVYAGLARMANDREALVFGRRLLGERTVPSPSRRVQSPPPGSR